MLNAAQDLVRGPRATLRSRDDLTVSGVITFHLMSSRSAQTPHYLRPKMTDHFAAASIAWASRWLNHRPGLSGKARRGQSNYTSVTGASLSSRSTARSVLCQNSTDRSPCVDSCRLQETV